MQLMLNCPPAGQLPRLPQEKIPNAGHLQYRGLGLPLPSAGLEAKQVRKSGSTSSGVNSSCCTSPSDPVSAARTAALRRCLR